MPNEISPGQLTPANYVAAFTRQTWAQFLGAGSRTARLRATAAGRTSRFTTGDRLLCFIDDVVRFVGVLEVTGTASPVPGDRLGRMGEFPIRVPVLISVERPLASAI